MNTATQARHSTLYRMVTDKHVCPYGLKARDLLRRQGYTVDDRWLTTRQATDAFKAEHLVRHHPTGVRVTDREPDDDCHGRLDGSLRTRTGPVLHTDPR